MGFAGEGHRFRDVLFVKSHLYLCPGTAGQSVRVSDFTGVVHLVRSPFDALVSERKRVVAVHNVHTSEPTWSAFVNGRLNAVPTTVLSWRDWMVIAAT